MSCRTARTARKLGLVTAAIASGLALTCGPAAATTTGERFVNIPRTASINSSSDIPVGVDAARFKTLTSDVASSWRIPIDGDTLAVPGNRDGVNSIGFSPNLPENVLGAYVYWPRRVYRMQKSCARHPGGRRVCKRVRRYVHTEIVEADVAFNTAFAWNAGPAYPSRDEIDLPTVEFHELGHFFNPNRPHGRRCSGSPLTESLGYGEWWRSRSDWYEEECTNAPAKRRSRIALGAAAPDPMFTRVVHQLPDRLVAKP
jgi:hypothetical protein